MLKTLSFCKCLRDSELFLLGIPVVESEESVEERFSIECETDMCNLTALSLKHEQLF